ncbi:hypothetical protein HER10_EVM0006490 [Colletotrichum scovillei]|uniref:Serine threonine protein phosphatase 2b catalytic subunit protein n=1 Tax=Colletotrichum scovillei TaxID=1209932 RepID=A0A9P7RFY7_9PEZI|nr:uncharacterized protein HER10_EVM0006490 [Colletotrichum scovillei]KAF4779769.1 hypothetical protein HER10_EVM0006490 [Colletotrichum scovillei]KAG7057409.1 serine threonine protein phosphatase 2b catalytic subunit protein [Colletotrichum scovillei]KAG7076006.1 serine threonine protein phosphatase 2b catalytic subunit protein [Colletotrichum scovillei]KAG7083088.1 serine threonine protein phosphatase 2b catalytic subunit protein [Colletotrichum scovillei]
MPPRLPLRPIAGRAASSLTAAKQNAAIPSRAVCLFCSLSTPSRPTTRTNATANSRNQARKALRQRRFQSTESTGSPPPQETTAIENPRQELIDTLLELQKHAVNHVNLSRLQLALQGLRQDPGQESIRVAILSLANGSAEQGKTTKDLLRLLLADPLGDEAEWERELAQHDPSHPLVVRIGQEHNAAEAAPRVTISKTNLLHELDVSSPALNGHGIELLLMEVNPFSSVPGPGETAVQDVEEAVLVPTVDIPSNTGRYTPITTPVHKALVVSGGVMGAASVAALPLAEYRDTVFGAVNLPEYPVEKEAGVTFQPIDVSVGSKGLDLIRQNIANAMEYERAWYKSNVPVLIQWLKTGVQTDEGQATKPAVRLLVASLLRNALAEIEAEESRLLSGRLSTEAASSGLTVMNERLAQWSQFAHEELQQQLDLAFAGTRWRKLGWWKLFWRVDDVGVLTTDMLSQRFLPGAERELVYLAGRIAESGVASTTTEPPVYAQPTSELQKSLPESSTVAKAVTQKPKWPTHIAFTRRYLHEETVPALQALAQKLVLQASSTSALTTALAGLLYVSQYASSIYEAGAVAALGVMWSLRRLQTKWETARTYWEGEVREEGRKAVRGVEQSVADTLDGSREGTAVEGAEELRRAKELVEKAEDALRRLK